MAPLSTNAISHFTHPAHNLNQLTSSTSFLCDGCKLPGTGSRFTCTICTFDLHDYCATCPTLLTSTTNHQHPMSLLVHRPQPDQTESCQICLNPIKGLAYICKDCNFWVHPLCVSRSSGQSKHQAGSSGSVPVAATSLGMGIGQQIAVGVGTKLIYDEIKQEITQVPLAESDASGVCAVPSATADSNTFGTDGDDGGGFFHAIKDGFLSIFESSME